jgi:hypothetical protein
VIDGDDLTVVTPSVRTASGRRGRACATRFCTCIAARSMSVPALKVTVSAICPSELAVDFM